MVACAGYLATKCWSTRQARKGATEPSDSGAEIWLVRVIAQFYELGIHAVMSYLVLARKWRPKTFSEVVGQEHVLRALINGLDQDRLHHAFLFSGTRGVGKTTLARIFAKSLNCEQGVSSTPCGKCNSCQEVDAGRFVDLIEVDAASRTKVDDTRELLDNVQYAPSRGRYKVYLIDEVHMLSTSSFNALLKTLEEPPPHVKFLFATTDPQKLPVTILSRCLQFNLRRLEISQIADHLAVILQKESIDFETDALTTIANAADGSMRDALSLLDQAISHGSGSVNDEQITQMLGNVSKKQTQNLIIVLIQNDAEALLQYCQELATQGRDFSRVLDELLRLLQRIATLQLVNDIGADDLGDTQQLQTIAQSVSAEMIQLYYQIALHGKRDLPYAADPKSGFEMTMLRMLSFQPHSSEQKTAVTSADTSKHNQNTVTKPAVTTKKTNTAIKKPEPSQQDKAVKEVQITKDIPANKEQTSVNNLNAENWLSTINSLKLTALVRQLADNSAFIDHQGEKLILYISTELAHLASLKAQERLEAALSKHIGNAVKISFQQQNSQQESVTTLAAERAEQAAIDQQRAADSIHNDPAIETIKKTFDARVIESTIKPIS